MLSFLTFNYFIMGIYIAFSIGQIFLYIFSNKNRVNLYMALLGVFSAIYLYYSILVHSEDSVTIIGKSITYQITFYFLMMGLLFTILFEMNGSKNRKFYFVLIGYLMLQFVLNLVLPNGIIYESITGVETIAFLSDNYNLVLGKINNLYYPLVIITYSLFLSFFISQVIIARSQKEKERKLIFSIIVGIYLLSNMYDVLIDVRVIQGIFLSEYFMLPVLLLLNLDIFFEIKKGHYFESNYKKIQENFNTLIETVDLIVVAVDLKGDILYVNPYFTELTGYSKNELVHNNFKAILVPREKHELFDHLFTDILQKKDKLKIDLEILCKDGKKLIVNWSNVPIEDPELNVIEILAVGADITERMESRDKIIETLNEIKKVKAQLEDENTFLKQSIIGIGSDGMNMIGESDTMRYVYHSIDEVAKTDTTVLIEGETGVGKELVAKSIHDKSERSEFPYIKVNCGALPKDLIESELFGHEKGAFTGAIGERKGRFELANNGTIFLDEIGELPLDLQVNLLRVIENSEFNRLGSERLTKVNVRVIAATNRNLKEYANKGLFRMDLYYRLSVFPITVPPLRKRRDDIPLLVNHFIGIYCAKMHLDKIPITVSNLKKLQEYTWPGNVRELKNVIERAVISSVKRKNLYINPESISQVQTQQSAENRALEEVERNHILSVLQETNWKISGKNSAASILDLNEGTLRSKMKKLSIIRENTSLN